MAVKKAAAKPAVKKPAAKKPAPKPAAKKPAAKPAPKPAAKPPAKPAPAKPVGTSTGTILDPKQWEADMARMKVAEEDREMWLQLNQDWNDSIIGENQQVADATSKSATDITGYKQQQRGNFVDFQNTKKDTNNALSYRGMGRSSAASRRIAKNAGTYNTTNTGLSNAITQSGNDANLAISRARSAGETTRAGIAVRKQAMSNRGAAAARK